MIFTETRVTTVADQIGPCHVVARPATDAELRQLGVLDRCIVVRVEGHTRQLLDVVALEGGRLTTRDLDVLAEAISGPAIRNARGVRVDAYQCAVRDLVERVAQRAMTHFLLPC